MKQLAKHRLSELLQGRLIDNIDFTAFISKVWSSYLRVNLSGLFSLFDIEVLYIDGFKTYIIYMLEFLGLGADISPIL